MKGYPANQVSLAIQIIGREKVGSARYVAISSTGLRWMASAMAASGCGSTV